MWSPLQSCCSGMKINTCGETAQFQAGSHESDPEYDTGVLFYIIVFPFMPFFSLRAWSGRGRTEGEERKGCGEEKKKIQ